MDALDPRPRRVVQLGERLDRGGGGERRGVSALIASALLASGLAGAAFTSSNPSVVEVVGTTAVGRSPGSASVCLAASPQECVSITVTSVAATPTNLLARAVTGASLSLNGRSTGARVAGFGAGEADPEHEPFQAAEYDAAAGLTHAPGREFQACCR